MRFTINAAVCGEITVDVDDQGVAWLTEYPDMRRIGRENGVDGLAGEILASVDVIHAAEEMVNRYAAESAATDRAQGYLAANRERAGEMVQALAANEPKAAKLWRTIVRERSLAKADAVAAWTRIRQDEAWAAKGEERCDRCGGAGGWKGWPGYTCFECGGKGSVPMKAETKRVWAAKG